ncbi:MAG: ATP synthase F0 subunit C [Bryobacteraceae bacterium]
MTKKKLLLVLAMLFLACSVASAQTPGNQNAAAQWVPIGGALGMAIASGLCGLGQGKAVASAMEGMARNPGAAKAIQLAMLIGLAFIETMALYTLLIVLMELLRASS